jgi:hypothetical protein
MLRLMKTTKKEGMQSQNRSHNQHKATSDCFQTGGGQRMPCRDRSAPRHQGRQPCVSYPLRLASRGSMLLWCAGRPRTCDQASLLPQDSRCIQRPSHEAGAVHLLPVC